MKEWQFNILFFVGVGGAVFLLFAPILGVDAGITKNPSAVAGVGTILTYVLTQKNKITKDDTKPDNDPPPEKKGGEQ